MVSIFNILYQASVCYYCRMRKYLVYVLLPLLVSLLIVAGFFLYIQITTPSGTVNPLFAQWNTYQIKKELRKIPLVSEKNIIEGFWYEIINEDGQRVIMFFDPETMAREGYTKEQISAFYERIKDARIVDRDSMRHVSGSNLSVESQTHNQVFSDSYKNNFNKVKASLENTQNKRAQDWNRLAYMYEIEGEFAKSDEAYGKACNLDVEFCSNFTLSLRGYLYGPAGVPVEGAQITTLSGPENATTNKDGYYEIFKKTRKLSKIRLRAEKNGYSDAYTDYNVVSDAIKRTTLPPMEMRAPLKTITIDTVNRVILDGEGELVDKGYLLPGEFADYTVPFTFEQNEEENLSGIITAEVHYFNRETIPSSFANIDIFDDSDGFVSNGMVTFGMPYIMLFDEKGQEIQVPKSNPILVTLRPSREDYFKNVTDEQLELAVNISSATNSYPLTLPKMKELGIEIIPWWILDRKKGIWLNEGKRLLDMDGTQETIFYTYNDME